MGYFKLIEHRVSETMSFLLRSSQGQSSINYLSIDMQVLLHESHMVKKNDSVARADWPTKVHKEKLLC